MDRASTATLARRWQWALIALIAGIAGVAARADPDAVRVRRDARLARRSAGRPARAPRLVAADGGGARVLRDDAAWLLVALLLLVPMIERQIGTLVDVAADVSRLVHRHRAALGRTAHRPGADDVARPRPHHPADPRTLGTRRRHRRPTCSATSSASGFALLALDREHRAGAGAHLLLPARLGRADRAASPRWCRATTSTPSRAWRANPTRCSAPSCAASSA